MSVIRKLSQQELQNEPWKAWNAFVDIVCMSEYEQLSPIQRIGHLVFWYQAEVENGGHMQYFENRRGRHLDETLAALETVGAPQYRAVLERAITIRRSAPRKPIFSVREYVDQALEGEYDEVDAEYARCSPQVYEILENWLKTHFSDFIQVI